MFATRTLSLLCPAIFARRPATESESGPRGEPYTKPSGETGVAGLECAPSLCFNPFQYGGTADGNYFIASRRARLQRSRASSDRAPGGASFTLSGCSCTA